MSKIFLLITISLWSLALTLTLIGIILYKQCLMEILWTVDQHGVSNVRKLCYRLLIIVRQCITSPIRNCRYYLDIFIFSEWNPCFLGFATVNELYAIFPFFISSSILFSMMTILAKLEETLPIMYSQKGGQNVPMNMATISLSCKGGSTWATASLHIQAYSLNVSNSFLVIF